MRLCDELDAMEDVLVEMFKHRAGVPIPWTKYDVESWWESFPAGGFLGYFTEEQ
jgi:hypothetical protein